VSGILAAASVPNPPLLLPGMTGGPVAEVEALRSACLAAIETMAGAEPDLIVLVGGTGSGELDSPLSLRVGRSLLAQAGLNLPIEAVGIPADAAAEECRIAGERIAEHRGRVGLLVMADGSACRSLKAPGYLDERAAPFDAMLTEALLARDWAGIGRLDRQLAAELLVGGRAAWQVMAGALASGESASGELASGELAGGELAGGELAGGEYAPTCHYRDDPFGVWYPVLTFS
jgi:hypothetical protein